MSKHNGTANVGQQHGAAANGASDGSAPQAGREGNGRFATGNRGGPGNPFGRTMASRRKTITGAVSEEKLIEIMMAMVELAIKGDVGAAKLVLQYAVGKPLAMAEPDRVEIEEWELHQKSAIHREEIDWVLNGAPIRTANVTTAVLTPEKEATYGAMLRGEIVPIDEDAEEELTPEEEAEMAEISREWEEEGRRLEAERMEKGRERPSNERSNGDETPSNNGRNGGGRPSNGRGNGRQGHGDVASAWGNPSPPAWADEKR